MPWFPILLLSPWANVENSPDKGAFLAVEIVEMTDINFKANNLRGKFDGRVTAATYIKVLDNSNMSPGGCAYTIKYICQFLDVGTRGRVYIFF